MLFKTLIAETEAQSTIDLEKTLNDCFSFEKKCRVAGDLPSLKAICVHIVRYEFPYICTNPGRILLIIYLYT